MGQSTAPVQIIVASGDPEVAELVPAYLRSAGYDTKFAPSGAEVLTQVRQSRPALLTLDVALPDTDGFTLARRLRLQMGAIAPTLFLVPARNGKAPPVGRIVGGDSHLAKPFSLDELTASIRTALRRSADPERRPHAVLRFADLEFNEDTLELRRSERAIRLSSRERRILRYLLLNPDRVVTREELIAHVWPYNFNGHRRAIDVHICNIRQKIGDEGEPLIHTLHGIGYALRTGNAR